MGTVTYCDFHTHDLGICLMPLFNGETRCRRHINKIEKVRIKASPRFRGDSDWQLENGMGTRKTGSNA